MIRYRYCEHCCKRVPSEGSHTCRPMFKIQATDKALNRMAEEGGDHDISAGAVPATPQDPHFDTDDDCRSLPFLRDLRGTC